MIRSVHVYLHVNNKMCPAGCNPAVITGDVSNQPCSSLSIAHSHRMLSVAGLIECPLPNRGYNTFLLVNWAFFKGSIFLTVPNIIIIECDSESVLVSVFLLTLSRVLKKSCTSNLWQFKTTQTPNDPVSLLTNLVFVSEEQPVDPLALVIEPLKTVVRGFYFKSGADKLAETVGNSDSAREEHSVHMLLCTVVYCIK